MAGSWNHTTQHRGWYRGIWCDSSWELAYVMWNLEHGIEIVRNTKKFSYPYRRGVRYYCPDFLVNGSYVEIKGVMDYISKKKLENFPYPIEVIGASKIRPYLKWAEAVHGKDFFRLLEPDANR